ncbi:MULTISPECIES: ABC transporter ATP-binding protein [unclassified Acidocella]|uniref:ABC transporter ATP-binding protein n=1 Tax=unclassified Acidocella TaxID=2648610 RepID=UPI00028DE290|nr:MULTISPECIES: ABC transporter ATP-binding protein [unclassified Acidocella]EKM99804.1 multidrug ABC transporter ATPase [Acidocella sp. MX-AZ02]WBO58420.1 ABC transporter ATP-binding protein [Acidocella sp. MX-AZ03]
MSSIITVSGLRKAYDTGFVALDGVDLDIAKGEIFALLGPNGAGKTTLISIICGLVRASAGEVRIDGHEINRDYRAARAAIGLVPQDISLEIFATVWDTVRFSRGLFGLKPDNGFIETLLRDLTLWDKRHARILELSGGMKRRVMIAKALAHEPKLLFLDEPTAGVDVNLRRDMWTLVRSLRQRGVTIILTTHYIQEAEEMADRVGVIADGKLLLVEQTAALMHRFGKRRLRLELARPLAEIPASLSRWNLELAEDGRCLVYHFDANTTENGVQDLLRALGELGLDFTDLETGRSSLEDIFLTLVEQKV